MSETDHSVPPELRDAAEPSSQPIGKVALPKVGVAFISAYTFALFGVWMLIMTPATVSLALRASQIDAEGATANYSLIASVGALIAMLANPMFGRLSDITRSRYGMRRPWMFVGVLGGAVAAAVLAVADSIPMLFLGWALMQFFVNAAIAALIAIIADQVPVEQRGLLSGIAGMTPVAGILVGTYFVQLVPENTFVIFMVPAAAALAGVFAFSLVLKDRRLYPAQQVAFGLGSFVGSFYVNPRKAPSFSWFLLSMFLVAGGLAVIQTYLFFFVQDHLGIAESEVPTIVFYAVLIMNVIALVVSLLSGTISDRIGRRKPVYAAAGLTLAAGSLVMLIASSLPLFFVGVAIAGIGYGVFTGLYLAIATETMTDPSTNARDLGVVNIAYTLPYSLIPLAAPLLLSLGDGSNYAALFIAAAVVSLAGIPVMAKVRTR